MTFYYALPSVLSEKVQLDLLSHNSQVLVNFSNCRFVFFFRISSDFN